MEEREDGREKEQRQHEREKEELDGLKLKNFSFN